MSICKHGNDEHLCSQCVDEQDEVRRMNTERVNMIRDMMLRLSGPMVFAPEIPFSESDLDEYTDEVLKVATALTDRFLEFRQEELGR